MEEPIVLSRISARVASDAALFVRAAQSDPVAFGEMYRRYHDRIHGYCLARIMDAQAAEDATQEVFLRLLQSDPASVENPRAWLYGVARNVSADCLRRRIRLAETGPAEEDSPVWTRLTAADTAETVMGREAARNIFLALRKLNPRYRTALLLREFHGQTSAEIAEALDTTVGAVDTLVSRARDAFGRTYAAVSGLPPACATTVELIYRRIGSGIDKSELQRLKSHVKTCPKCRAEYRRTVERRGLSALIPFLVPSKAFGSIPQAVMSNPAAVHLVERCSEMNVFQHLAMRIGAVAVAATLAIANVGGAEPPHAVTEGPDMITETAAPATGSPTWPSTVTLSATGGENGQFGASFVAVPDAVEAATLATSTADTHGATAAR